MTIVKTATAFALMGLLTACTSSGPVSDGLAPSRSGPASAVVDGSYRGTSVNQGGSKSFCKGSNPVSASVSGGRIVVEVPLAVGGTAAVSGKIAGDGSVRASGSRFSFTGTASGRSISGTWRGPSCYGTWTFKPA